MKKVSSLACNVNFIISVRFNILFVLFYLGLIQQKIIEWTQTKGEVDVILTTGGTGK